MIYLLFYYSLFAMFFKLYRILILNMFISAKNIRSMHTEYNEEKAISVDNLSYIDILF